VSAFGSVTSWVNPPERTLKRNRSGNPIVRVGMSTSWNPRTERRAVAKKRIMDELERRVEEKLDDVQESEELAGYYARDTEPKYRVHLGWLYARLAHRVRSADIADEASRAIETGDKDISESAVRVATNKLAKRFGITLPEPVNDYRPQF
jgi:hypothetical protein